MDKISHPYVVKQVCNDGTKITAVYAETLAQAESDLAQLVAGGVCKGVIEDNTNEVDADADDWSPASMKNIT